MFVFYKVLYLGTYSAVVFTNNLVSEVAIQ